jgi:hypothetical protein
MTIAHMPRCDSGLEMFPASCTGSGTYTHRGLQLVRDNQAAYHADAMANGEADGSTQYVNILITDGQYVGFSTDSQVAAPLVAMASAGVPTFIVGFGGGLASEVVQEQLVNMAGWGGTAQPYFAASQAELELALRSIIEGLNFDPCCQFNDCSENPEPTGGEADPLGACLGDEDCLALERCVAGQCGPAPCEQDAECVADVTPPLVCEEGVCAPGPCADSSECPGSQVCDDGRCVASGACVEDEQCPPTDACVAGECRPRPCGGDMDCGLGQVCDLDEGVCVPGTPAAPGGSGWGPSGGYDDSGDDSYGTYGSTDAGSGSAGVDQGCGCGLAGSPTRPQAPLLGCLSLLWVLRIRRRRARSG